MGYLEVFLSAFVFLLGTMLFRKYARYQGNSDQRVCPKCKTPGFSFKQLKGRKNDPKFLGLSEVVLYCSYCGFTQELNQMASRPEDEPAD